ncbi:hypothetical protein EV127DRAFT_256068 [Xylaria flabelliformis]|nr:hypothetical protein EV127DRAFT_256068 [Xylaria flabelliformis]
MGSQVLLVCSLPLHRPCLTNLGSWPVLPELQGDAKNHMTVCGAVPICSLRTPERYEQLSGTWTILGVGLAFLEFLLEPPAASWKLKQAADIEMFRLRNPEHPMLIIILRYQTGPSRVPVIVEHQANSGSEPVARVQQEYYFLKKNLNAECSLC